MNENEWTETISVKLNKEFCKGNIHVKVLQKIPYFQEIEYYTAEWKPVPMEPTRFETDLVLYEEKGSQITPVLS